MACLKQQQAAIKMEAVKIVPADKLVECSGSQSRYGPSGCTRDPPPVGKCAWPLQSEIITNQACTDMPGLDKGRSPNRLARTPPRTDKCSHGHRKASAEMCFHRQAPADEVIVNQYVLHQSAVSEPLECPTCGHVYNATNKRPRILSCLHSVCEECLQILYESCPKYKFISCPTCRRETVLFTDYGLAALAVNTSILARLPTVALTANPGQWGGEADRSCYQTFQQYCGAVCSCHLRNPLASCTIM
ncbi:RING finger protein 208 [Amblyraja radiata]|uniref:RING finger protein 208 n=1 Tax=Amblyraja radiata TaxID=386614 RepID=UPI0014031F87|nr:RING finger protein 208 [Amblyraja radiata]XP_055516386.1 RING finger protein 208 [Leucoraja erinacea]